MSKIVNGVVAGQIVNGKKLCCICERMLPLIEFGKSNIVKSGYASNCKHCKVWRDRAHFRVLKMEMILAYGGKCFCCGEKGIEFLTIEHINNDGKAHREELGGLGIKVWLDLKRRGWPKDGFTILCWNCNCAKKYGKFCMHDTEQYEEYNSILEAFLNDSDRDKYFKLKGKL